MNLSLKEQIKNIVSWIKKPVLNWRTDDGNNTWFTANDANGNAYVSFGIGSGGVNHGVYSHKLGRWLVYAGTGGTVIDNKDPFNSGNQSAGTLPTARLPVMFKVVSGTTSVFTVNAGGSTFKDVTISVPSGYELVGCVGFNSSHNQAGNVGAAYKISSTQIRITIKNHATSTNWTDTTLTAYGLCALSNIY